LRIYQRNPASLRRMADDPSS